MAKTEKVEKVAALQERIAGSQAVLLTDFRGLTVHDATELRRSLLEGGASFSVVKNTLMKRAAGEAGAGGLEALLSGPTAVAFVGGDPVSAAKKVVDAAKKFPTLVLKGAFMDGKVLSAEEAQSLATLEPRDVMLSKIAGLLKGEMSRAASMFVALQSRFLGVLEAYRDKLPGAETDTTTSASEAPDAAPSSVEAPAEHGSVEGEEEGGAAASGTSDASSVPPEPTPEPAPEPAASDAEPEATVVDTADAPTEPADDAATSEAAEEADAAVAASDDSGEAAAIPETEAVEDVEGEE